MEGDELHLEVPAEPEYVARIRHEVLAWAEKRGAATAALEAVALAVTEAVTNAVVHAYRDRPPQTVEVDAWDDDGHLFVVVCDHGIGMKPRVDSPGLGLGLGLIAQMADNLRVTAPPETVGTRIAMRFSADGSGLTA